MNVHFVRLLMLLRSWTWTDLNQYQNLIIIRLPSLLSGVGSPQARIYLSSSSLSYCTP